MRRPPSGLAIVSAIFSSARSCRDISVVAPAEADPRSGVHQMQNRSRLYVVPLNSSVQRTPTQSQGPGGVTYVVRVSSQRLAYQERFYFLQAHVLDPVRSIARWLQTEIGNTKHILIR